MATKKVKETEEVEEVKQDSSSGKCEMNNCGGGRCAYSACPNGCVMRPCRSWGWRIFSGIFRMILLLIILAIVFALGATVGGAGMVGYMRGGDFSFGPGMMNGGDGNWTYKIDKLFDARSGYGKGMMFNSLKEVGQNSPVRIFGNITEVRDGELTILDNSSKEVKVISGSFTIIETSKGELGLKDLKLDEGVTVYGILVDGGAIKASNIRVAR